MIIIDLQRGGGANSSLGKGLQYSQARFLTCVAPLGFTLAEILIALGIIGIVAALTMPALVANYQEKATVTKLKKIYSVMSQAYARAIAENGDPTGWDLIANDSPEGAKNIGEKLALHMKLLATSEANKLGPNFYSLILADGARIEIVVRNAECTEDRGGGSLKNTCAAFGVFLDDKPKIPGVNNFSFVMTKDAIIPHGTAENTLHPFEDNCAKGKNLEYCTAWVIFNENMDYLHCDDLSWDGKTRCD